MNKLALLLLFLVFLFHSVSAQFTITSPMPDTVCPGELAMFQVMVSPIPDSIRWQYADTPNGSWNSPSIGTDRVDTTLIYVFNTQFYDQKFFRVVVWDEGIIMDSSESASLTVNPLPIAEITPGGPTTFCQGNSVTLTASSANTYLWSNGSTMQSIAVFDPGNYWVTVTGMNGCSATSTPIVVNINPLPIAEISPGGPTTFCQGNSVTLTASSAISYAWNNGGTMQSIAAFDSGNYWVTVTDMNGCTASSAPILVTVNPLPNAIISPSGPTTFCQGNSVTLTSSSANSYLWSNGGTMQSIIVTETDDYSVTLTSGSGCSSASAVTAVTVNPNPEAGINTTPSELINILEQREILFADSSLPSMESCPIVQWSWDFGENAMPPNAVFNHPDSSTLVKYTQAGTKKVKLSIIDIKGCSNMDSLLFAVNSINSPSVDLVQVQEAKCIGDIAIIRVTVLPVDPINYIVLDKIDWQIEDNAAIYLGGDTAYNESKLTIEARFVFTKIGSFGITAIGYRKHKTTGVEQSGTAILDVDAGSAFPQIEAILASPSFLCRGDLMSFEIHLSTMENADIEYTIDNKHFPTGKAINGQLLIENVAASNGLDQIVLRIISIDLSNGCRNDTLKDSLTIEVKSKPSLIVADSILACMGKPSTLVASGAESYTWRDQIGQVVSVSSDLSVPTDSIQNLVYEVTGTTGGCSTVDTAFVEIVAPPSPSIDGDTTVCNGQRVMYKSNSNTGNLWSVIGGNIEGDNTSQLVMISWNTSGSVSLKQEVGGCDASTTRNVTVSTEESPPTNDLVYLTGGGILLYPNPDLIPDLCYKWFLGDSLIDTFQGCVVGTGKSDEELSMFKVIVYYCSQSEECAQVLSYRSKDEEPEITDFKLKIFPNPNSGVFALEYEVPIEGSYIQYIFNCSGQLLHKEKVSLDLKAGKLNLSLPNADSGIYFIKLINSATGEYRVVPVSILH